MKFFNRFRAKDPVLATIISMGMIMSAQAVASAQSDWEEVGPETLSAQQQLMSAPPRIGANASGQVNYRPPVSTPVVNEVQNGYVVQSGDTLPKIAMKVYGDPNRWQDLMVLNNIDNGNRIYVGQKLITVASNKIVAADAPVAAHEIAEMPEESESADASYYGNTSSRGTYTVRKGDTLGKIAKECLGSTSKWQQLAKANPSINPNKLKVGDVLVIPGAKVSAPAPAASISYANDDIVVAASPIGTSQVSERAVSAQPWQMSANNVETPYSYQEQVQAEPSVSEPSFDPNTAPLIAPPPPPAGMYGNYAAAPAPVPYAPQYAPPAPPAPTYTGEPMVPPPPVPVAPDVPFVAPTSVATPNTVSYQTAPVAVSSRELYREPRYRLPDELKTTDYDPYFTNLNGYRGLFNTESALIPYVPTWNLGFSFKYDDLKYYGGKKDIIKGHKTLTNLNLNYTGHKVFVGVTVPFQSWKEKPAAGGLQSSLSAMHDPSVKFGYQVWKNLEGTHAVNLHLEGKFSGKNYHSAILGTGLKTKEGSYMGPAGATKGNWVEMGAAYSGIQNDRWSTHLNMAVARNSKAEITKLTFRAGTDYRVNRNFALVGELQTETYEAPTHIYGEKGTNAELLLGFSVFNDSWQCNVGFPMAIKHAWGTQGSFGVVAGINHRWD